MAMRQQTVQRYGGFPIPAIVVRDAWEALSAVTRDIPSRLHGRLHERLHGYMGVCCICVFSTSNEHLIL